MPRGGAGSVEVGAGGGEALGAPQTDGVHVTLRGGAGVADGGTRAVVIGVLE